MKLTIKFEEEELAALESCANDIADPCGFIDCNCVEGCENCPMNKLIPERENYIRAIRNFVSAERSRNKRTEGI